MAVETVEVRLTPTGGRQLIGLIEDVAKASRAANAEVKQLQSSLARLSKVNVTPGGGRQFTPATAPTQQQAPRQSIRPQGPSFRDFDRSFNQNQFKNLRDSLDPAGASVRKFTADSEQLRLALARGVISQREFNSLNVALRKQTSGTSDSFRSLAGNVRIAAVAFAALGAVRLADQFTQLQNRLRTVTDNEQQLASATRELFNVSQQTRSSFQGTVEIFTRSSLAAKELGLSQQELVQFTKSLNQAVILSGASAQEANAALIQLSQGIASGTLRGDELRSVLEQLPVVADVIAAKFKVTRGELRQLGLEGKISARDIIQAFAEASGDLDSRFGKSIATVSQAFTVLQNSAVQALGTIDSKIGATRTLADAIVTLAKAINLTADAFDRFSNISDGALSKGLSFLGVPAALSTLEKLISKLEEARIEREKLAAINAPRTNSELSLFTGAARQNTEPKLQFDAKEFERIRDAADPAAKAIRDFRDAELQLRASIGKEGGLKEAEFDRVFGAIAEKTRAARDPLGALITELEREQDALGMSNRERQTQIALQQEINSLQSVRGKLSDGEKARLKITIEETQEARELANAIDAVKGPTQDLRRQQDLLAVALAAGKIEQDEYRAATLENEAAQNRLQQAFENVLDPLAELRRDLENPIAVTITGSDFDIESEIRERAARRRDEGRRSLTPEQADEERALVSQRVRAEQLRAEVEKFKGPADEFVRRESLIREAAILAGASQDELTAALRRNKLELLETDRTIQGGIIRGLERLRDEFADTGSAIEDALTGAFMNAEDALTDFFTTGRLDSQKFFADLQADIVRLAVRKTLLEPLAGQIESIVPALAGFFGGGGQEGTTGKARDFSAIAGQATPALDAANAIASGADSAATAALTTAGTTLTTAATSLATGSTALTTGAGTLTGSATALTGSAAALTSAAGALVAAAGSSAASSAASGIAGAASAAGSSGAITAATGFRGVVKGRPGTDANFIGIRATSGEEITVRTPAQQRMGPVPGFEFGGQIRRRAGFDEMVFARSNQRAVGSVPRDEQGSREPRPIEQKITNVTNNVRQEVRVSDPDPFRATERQLMRVLRRMR